VEALRRSIEKVLREDTNPKFSKSVSTANVEKRGEEWVNSPNEFNALEFSLGLLLEQESDIKAEYLKLKEQRDNLDDCLSKVTEHQGKVN